VDIGRFCAPIRQALARLPKRVRLIAEPGRYIIGPAAIGVATVMGRARREGHWWYYLDDGLYGSYSGQLYDHARYPVEALRQGGEQLPAVLAGPTCDSIDVIAENLMLPELKCGDLIVGRAMGAYTWASASEFNFFPKATVVAVNRRAGDHGGFSTSRKTLRRWRGNWFCLCLPLVQAHHASQGLRGRKYRSSAVTSVAPSVVSATAWYSVSKTCCFRPIANSHARRSTAGSSVWGNSIARSITTSSAADLGLRRASIAATSASQCHGWKISTRPLTTACIS